MKAIVLVAALASSLSLLTLGRTTDKIERQNKIEQQNLEVMRGLHEKMNRGDVRAVVEGFAEDTRNHGRPVGRDGVRSVLEDIYRTFPDWRMETIEMIAEADSVVVRYKVSGTHQGTGKMPVNGGMLIGVEPTGKRFEAQHIHWYKLRDGKIVEHHANRDDIGMMQQLGLLPLGAETKLK